MGLDTSHDCWHGPYSAFHRWRAGIARLAGIDLEQMEGFGGEWRSWDSVPQSPLLILLMHSDCDGEIAARDCGPLADELERLVQNMPAGADYDSLRPATERFISGLRAAAHNNEDVVFS